LTAETAAALLGTSTTILSLWEERFGYPVPEPSADGQRLYPDEMMIALRDALGRELSIASAITEARRVQSIRPRWRGRTRARGRLARRPETSEEAR
jgi:hypothetical protein